jgi:hypothetical protein
MAGPSSWHVKAGRHISVHREGVGRHPLAWIAQHSTGCYSIIHLIIQTIQRAPSRSDATDEASHVSWSELSGGNQSDGEHLSTDLAVGGSSPSWRAPKAQVNRPGLLAFLVTFWSSFLCLVGDQGALWGDQEARDQLASHRLCQP